MAIATVPAPTPAAGALARLQDAIEGGMAPALAIMLDESLFAQVQRIAGIMSKADGFVPKHCIGRTEVCFAITTRSLVWRLDPFAVAQATYQPVEGGKVALCSECQARVLPAALSASVAVYSGTPTAVLPPRPVSLVPLRRAQPYPPSDDLETVRPEEVA